MSAFFYLKNCNLQNAELPFFFITGDEGFWETITSDTITKLLGMQATKNENFSGKEIWQELKKKFNVFHLRKEYFKKYEATV